MRWILSCACLLLASTAPAQVYKWVDANGVTHYGERPPAAGKSREVQLRDASPRAPGGGASAHGAQMKEKELEFRKRQALREQEETRLAQEKARRDQECRASRAELADLRATRRLYELNERGERVFMSDAQRDAEVARREAEYNRRCG
ncbi:MAG: DUF4124 domain-containing protein [Burkholderiales bacterium]|nr:DUF4124 domain-containing protein [Burkholderiales bacterium]